MTALASVVLLRLRWNAWRRSEDRTGSRVLLTLVPIAGLAFTWFLCSGNMLWLMTIP